MARPKQMGEGHRQVNRMRPVLLYSLERVSRYSVDLKITHLGFSAGLSPAKLCFAETMAGI
jgi:hypothetical protein